MTILAPSSSLTTNVDDLKLKIRGRGGDPTDKETDKDTASLVKEDVSDV